MRHIPKKHAQCEVPTHAEPANRALRVPLSGSQVKQIAGQQTSRSGLRQFMQADSLQNLQSDVIRVLSWIGSCRLEKD